tara:strand:- start:1063 stop:3363 length:2301 start_codon:yes stop_codon:yes gene_type:complete
MNQKMKSKHNTEIIIILTASLFAYIALRLNVIYYARYTLIEWQHKPTWANIMYQYRYIIFFSCALIAIALVWCEFANHSVSKFIQHILTNSKKTYLMILMIGVTSGSYYLQPGSTTASADGHLYVTWASLLRNYFYSLEAPLWSTGGALGFPFTQFYNWGSYIPTALLGLIINNVLLANKLSLFIFHIYSTFGMYLFVRKFTKTKESGLVSACAHGFAFYIYHKLVLVGLLPMSLPIYLLPWQLYYSECMLEEKSSKRSWALTSITSAMSICSHLAYGMTSMSVLLIYIIIRIFTKEKITSKIIALFKCMSSLTLGMCASSLFIVPVLTEPNNPVIGFITRDRFIMDLVEFQQVFNFKHSYLTSNWWGGYIGVSVSIMAISCMILNIYRRNIKIMPIITITLVSVWLVFGPNYAPYLFEKAHKLIPFGTLVYGMHSPGYFIMYLGITCAVLCGVFVKTVSNEPIVYKSIAKIYQRQSIKNKFRKTIIPVTMLASITILIDLMPLTLIVNAMKPTDHISNMHREKAILYIEENGDGNSRVFEHGNDSLLDIYVTTGQPQTAGMGDDKPPSHPFIDNISDQESLYLSNVRYVISSEKNYDFLDQVPLHSILYENKSHSIILASKTTEHRQDVSYQHKPHNINQTNNTAKTIYITDKNTTGNLSLNQLHLEARIISYNTNLQNISVQYELNQPAFVQLSVSYYPYQIVKLDKKIIKPTQTSLGLIGFWSDSGKHDVEIIPKLSPNRHYWATINLLALIILLLCIYKDYD